MCTRILATTVLLATLCAGCASTTDPAAAERARADRIYQRLTGMGLVRGETVRRVPNFRVDGWQDLDARTLILTAGVHEHWLVELFTPCQGLEFAFGIGLESATGSLMTGDSILVRGMHQRVERCRIREIFALDDLPGYTEEGG